MQRTQRHNVCIVNGSGNNRPEIRVTAVTGTRTTNAPADETDSTTNVPKKIPVRKVAYRRKAPITLGSVKDWPIETLVAQEDASRYGRIDLSKMSFDSPSSSGIKVHTIHVETSSDRPGNDKILRSQIDSSLSKVPLSTKESSDRLRSSNNLPNSTALSDISKSYSQTTDNTKPYVSIKVSHEPSERSKESSRPSTLNKHPPNSSVQIKEPLKSAVQTNELPKSSAQIKEPLKSPAQIQEPARTSVQTKEPQKSPVQIKEPLKSSFQTREPPKSPVQIREPPKSSVQAEEPHKSPVEVIERQKSSVQTKEPPKSPVLNRNRPKAQTVNKSPQNVPTSKDKQSLSASSDSSKNKSREETKTPSPTRERISTNSKPPSGKPLANQSEVNKSTLQPPNSSPSQRDSPQRKQPYASSPKNSFANDKSDPEFKPRNIEIKENKQVKQWYSVDETLGSGKFGVVRLGRENATGLKCAIKFIPIGSEEERDSVLTEIKVMVKLQHPRLIQLLDAFMSKDEAALVMEVISGGELFERIIDDNFELTESKCVQFMREVCEGVKFIHEQHVIHLDLKPENILCLDRTGFKIKIIDFGLARFWRFGEDLRVMFGTPEFVAPEILAYDQVSHRTDMWSVGVICYVLLSGLSPFMGDSDRETYINITKAKLGFDYPEFKEISADAKDFVKKLIVKEMRNRMTAEEALGHKWLQKRTSLIRTGTVSKRALRRFVYRRKWQKAKNIIVALLRMGVTLSR